MNKYEAAEQDIQHNIRRVDADKRVYYEIKVLPESVDAIDSALKIAAGMEWMPVDTIPDNGAFLCCWPAMKLDEDDNISDEIDGGTPPFIGVCERLAGQWNGEPDTLNACGGWFGDDYEYAAEPTHWLPLPPAPKEK